MGFVAVAQATDEWEIERIATTPEMRRRAVGRDLLSEVRYRARAASCEKLNLEVASRNRAAVSMYTEAGFLVVGRRRGYYPASDRSDADDALLMTLFLGGGLSYESREVEAAQFTAAVVENRKLSGGYFELVLDGEVESPVTQARPGQFIMLRGEWGRDLINGRAFSILRAGDGRRFSVLAKVFGRGTALMAAMEPGDRLTCTGPLGRAFPDPGRGPQTLQFLVAGGVGLPPLHLHARTLAAAGRGDSVRMFYGGRSAQDIVLVDELERTGIEVVVATDDGSLGHRGLVTAPLEEALDLHAQSEESPAVELLACGPTPMLRAVRSIALRRGLESWLCLEEQMACGFGVCLGCAVPVYGEKPYKYCCTDGPVFPGRELRWS